MMEPSDWIKCIRNTAAYRLGCKIDPDPVMVKLSIDDRFIESSVVLFGLREILSVQVALKVEQKALVPQLKVRINWSAECWSGGEGADVYNGKVFLYVNGLKTDKSVKVGDYEYSVDVPSWSIIDVNLDNKFKIQTNFAIKDESAHPSLAGNQALSPNCRMIVSDLRLGFVELAISEALLEVESDAKAQATIMTATSILHARLIDNKNIFICQLIKLADGLRRLQGVQTTNELRLSAQRLIADFVENASAKDVINKPTDTEAFQYFLENEVTLSEQVGGLQCSNVLGSSLIPSKDIFIQNGQVVNPEGAENADTYQAAREDLRKLISLAWALLSASKASARLPESIDWISNYSLLIS